jgi:hypothetical protein
MYCLNLRTWNLCFLSLRVEYLDKLLHLEFFYMRDTSSLLHLLIYSIIYLYKFELMDNLFFTFDFHPTLVNSKAPAAPTWATGSSFNWFLPSFGKTPST